MSVDKMRLQSVLVNGNLSLVILQTWFVVYHSFSNNKFPLPDLFQKCFKNLPLSQCFPDDPRQEIVSYDPFAATSD